MDKKAVVNKEYQQLLVQDFRRRVYPLALACSLIFTVFFLVNVSGAGNVKFIVPDAVAAILFAALAILIKREFVKPLVGSVLILGIVMVVFTMVILFSGSIHGILFFYATIPFFAFYMLGTKAGRIHGVLMLALVLFLELGAALSWFEVGYSSVELGALALLLLFTTISAGFFEGVREETFFNSYQQGVRHEALMQAIEEVYYRVTMDGVILDIGEAVLPITGFEASEVEGKAIEMFYANPGERENYINALKSSGSVKNYPVEIVGKYGQHIMILMSSRIVFNESDSPVYIEGMFRDVTKERKLESERKEHLDHLRALSLIESILIEQDFEKSIKRSIKEMRRMFAVDRVFLMPVNKQAQADGFESFFVASNEKFPIDMINFMQESELATYLASMPKQAGIKPTVVDSLTMLPQRMIDSYQLQSHLMIVFQIKPEINWLLGMHQCGGESSRPPINKRLFIDISHRIRGVLGQLNLQRSLQATVTRVEVASKAKSEFLATMSHELRTPLHGVVGLLDLLAADKESMSPEQQKNLTLAQSSASVLRSLIDDVLDLAKAESGKIELHQQSFLLKDALHSALLPFVMKAREKQLDLSLELKCVPATVVGDVVRLRQILLNLVGNAMKFTAKGYVRIVASQDDETLQINIEDSGIGIEYDKQADVFKPFSQVHDLHILGENLQEKGTGLGTTISKHFIEMMGGALSLQSEPGVGTTLSMRLPLKQVGRERLAAVLHMDDFTMQSTSFGISGNSDLQENVKRNRGKVLLAEDDPVGRKVAQKRLERAGFQVESVSDGFSAWESVRNENYDLLLTDIRMPGLDGMALTKNIRELESKSGKEPMLIVGLSAYALEEIKQQALQCGMNEFISKPVDMDELLQKLEQHDLPEPRLKPETELRC